VVIIVVVDELEAADYLAVIECISITYKITIQRTGVPSTVTVDDVSVTQHNMSTKSLTPTFLDINDKFL
jgi:hypothetical protein